MLECTLYISTVRKFGKPCTHICFYLSDDFEVAQKKLKLAELTSDLQTDREGNETITLKSKRKVSRPSLI